MFWKQSRTVITHSGSFHADEATAVAILLLLDKQIKIVRTRDKKIIESKKEGDIVVDVGYVFDPEKFQFDHHQPSFTEKRENGLTYASAGLVWKYFGMELCEKNNEVWQRVDEKIIQAIDADDNGVTIYENKAEYNGAYTISQAVSSFKPSWNETLSHDEQFFKAVEVIKQILEREIIRAKSFVLGKVEVEKAYQAASDKRIIVIDRMYPYQKVLQEYPEPLYVVANDGIQTTWSLLCVGEKDIDFSSKKLLPESWAGKNGKDFEEASGVAGANFCHKQRFIAVANSKEGALKLAEIAANS